MLNAPDGKPFIVRITGDPKQVARGVLFCIEAPPEVESLGVPSFDNSQVELDKVMHLERERIGPTADCYKVGRIGTDETLTIRYPAKFKKTPSGASPPLKFRNSGDGYSVHEVPGPRSKLEPKQRKPLQTGSTSTGVGSNRTTQSQTKAKDCTRIGDCANQSFQQTAAVPARQSMNQNFHVYEEADSAFKHGFPSGLFGSIDLSKAELNSGCIDDPTSPTGCSPDPTRPDATRGTAVVRKTYGINFSPYENGQDPHLGAQVTAAQTLSRMQIIAPYTNWVRSFGSSMGLENTPSIARQLGLKIAATAWISSDAASNAIEINNLISAAKAGQVDVAIVGSEAILNNYVTTAQLITYMNQVRQAIPAGIPVATSDVWGTFVVHPELIAASDQLWANFYPYWEGTSVNYALRSVESEYQQLVSLAGSKPVIIAETGWPSGGNVVGAAVPSAANANLYADQFLTWASARNVPSFYSKAFDEEFKAVTEGPQGAHWGIFDETGVVKPGMEAWFSGQNAPVISNSLSGPVFISSIYVLPYGSSDLLEVQATGVAAGSYAAATYIQVSGSWWSKPTSAMPTVPLNADGTASIPVVTGGNDQNATNIAVYLIPATCTHPQADGGALPAVSCAAASLQVSRSAASISAIITDNVGQPIAGATIADSVLGSTTSGPDGRYSFYRISSPGTTTLTVTYPNYDQVKRNIPSIYEASATILRSLRSGRPEDMTDASKIADALAYALHHDNLVDPVPLVPDASAGLHTAYINGDIGFLNVQPSAGLVGDVRIAGFSSGTGLCGSTSFCLVLDGATGGNKAWAILALAAAYSESGNSTYLTDAETIGGWIISNLRDSDLNGFGGYFIGFNDEGERRPNRGKATEYNLDLYAAFSRLSEIEMVRGNSASAETWRNAAKVAGDFVAAMYDNTTGRFFTGTVPATSALSSGPGVCPSPTLKAGNDLVNTCDFVDSNTFTTLPTTAVPAYTPYRQSIKAAAQNYHGFDLVVSAAAAGIAWEFTGHATLEIVKLSAGTAREVGTAEGVTTYLDQIRSAQAPTPFGDGLGLPASTLQNGDSLPANQCLSTPFQCTPERVGLAATGWAIFADQAFNSLGTASPLSYFVNLDNQPSATPPSQVIALTDQRGSRLVSLGADATIYYPGARFRSRGSPKWIVPDHEGTMITRPLRVIMLNSGGAHLTVTSEVDPSPWPWNPSGNESIEDAIHVRPLRVRMLNSGGARLTVTSEVDPSLEYQEQDQIRQLPARSLGPKNLNLISLPLSTPDSRGAALLRRRSTFQ